MRVRLLSLRHVKGHADHRKQDKRSSCRRTPHRGTLSVNLVGAEEFLDRSSRVKRSGWMRFICSPRKTICRHLEAVSSYEGRLSTGISYRDLRHRPKDEATQPHSRGGPGDKEEHQRHDGHKHRQLPRGKQSHSQNGEILMPNHRENVAVRRRSSLAAKRLCHQR